MPHPVDMDVDSTSRGLLKTSTCHEDSDETDPDMPQLVPAPVKGAKPAPKKSAKDLSKMSKLQRRDYHEARLLSLENTSGPANTRSERREFQESQRKSKEERCDLQDRIRSLLHEAEEADKDLLAEAEAELLSARAGLFEVVIDGDVDLEAGMDQDIDLEGGIDAGEADEAEDLVGCIRRWVRAADKPSCEDLSATLRLWGHGQSTAQLQLRAVLLAILEKLPPREQFESIATSKRPAALCEALKPQIEFWSSVIDSLYQQAFLTGTTAADTIVEVASECSAIGIIQDTDDFVESRFVGVLMRLREEVETLTDYDLLAALQRQKSNGPTLQKFIAFLEKEADDSGESGDDAARVE